MSVPAFEENTVVVKTSVTHAGPERENQGYVSTTCPVAGDDLDGMIRAAKPGLPVMVEVQFKTAAHRASLTAGFSALKYTELRNIYAAETITETPIHRMRLTDDQREAYGVMTASSRSCYMKGLCAGKGVFKMTFYSVE